MTSLKYNCDSRVHEVLNKGKKRRPSKKGNHKKCRRGNIILFVGRRRQEGRREHRAQEGGGKIMAIQWIYDNAKKSWNEWNKHLLNQIMRMRGKMGEKP